MQNEITKSHNLLNDEGELIESGWSKNLIMKYNREDINSTLDNIKEWDYYYTGNDDLGIGISMANMGKVRALSVHIMNYKKGKYYMNFASCPLLDKPSHKMPLDSNGDVEFENEFAKCNYHRTPSKHHIKINFNDYHDSTNLKIDLSLEIPNTDSMVIAVPFEEGSNLFYYNQKINCLHPEGVIEFGSETYHISKKDTFSVLDWGRGVWPEVSTWYWGSASGKVNGEDFGFNIGYGFGDTSAASENLLFYKGKAHKLENITFHIPENSFTDTWSFSSSDNRFEMKFSPIIDRHSDTARGKYNSNQHQVFGKFYGKVTLDDGTIIEITDFMGFAEKVENTIV